VALSTTEVEYMAATHASKDAVWLQRLCSGIGCWITERGGELVIT
jgi:hypothetical protein